MALLCDSFASTIAGASASTASIATTTALHIVNNDVDGFHSTTVRSVLLAANFLFTSSSSRSNDQNFFISHMQR
jgi:hypothetical protein